MNVKYLFITILFLTFNVIINAQIDTVSVLNDTSRLQPIILESRPVTTSYTLSPTLSAILIGKGQLEFNNFNTFQTFEQIQRFPGLNGFRPDTLESALQNTRLDHVLQIQLGVSSQNRLNIGLDLYASHLLLDTSRNPLPLSIFRSADPGSFIFRGFSAIGPRIRWTPFEKLPELTIQSSLAFGLGQDFLKRMNFERDRTQFLTQFVIYQNFAQRFTALGEVGFSVFIRNNDNPRTTFNFPIFLYTSAQLTGLSAENFPKVYTLLSFFHQSNYWAGENIDGFNRISRTNHIGLGLTSQLSWQWAVFLIGQTKINGSIENSNPFLISVEQNNWYIFTLGLRYYLSQYKGKKY